MRQKLVTRLLVCAGLIVAIGFAVACCLAGGFSETGYEMMLRSGVLGDQRDMAMKIDLDAYESTTRTEKMTLRGSVTGGQALRSATVYRLGDAGIVQQVPEAGELGALRVAYPGEVDGGRFQAEDVFLAQGKNNLLVVAVDQEGKRGSAFLTVMYEPGSVEPIDPLHVAIAEDGTQYVDNMLDIVFTAETTHEEALALVESIGGTVQGWITPLSRYQVRMEPMTAEALQTLADQLMDEHDQVRLVSIEWIRETGVESYTPQELAARAPNDPWGTQETQTDWNEQAPQGLNWNLEAIQTQSAWMLDHYYRRATVGIIDTGFTIGHDDVSVHQLDGVSSADHGTHIAGVIGAVQNNHTGITGIIARPQLVGFSQTPDLDGVIRTRTIDDLDALVQCVQAGASVVNISLSRIVGNGDTVERMTDAARREGKELAMGMADLLARGYDFVVVESAGNNALPAGVKGYFTGVKLVEETDLREGMLPEGILLGALQSRVIVVANAANSPSGTARFSLDSASNGGDLVDIAAPGTDIFSTMDGGFLYFGRYGFMSGTSMAAPHVAAGAALVWSANPEIQGDVVRELLVESAVDMAAAQANSPRPDDIYPMLNIYEAVLAGLAYERIESFLEIQVVDAVTNAPVAATLSLYEGIREGGPLVTTIQTTGEGATVFPMQAGEYIMNVDAGEGYISISSYRVIVAPDETTTYTVPMSKTLGEGETRISLSWGARPNDLDSHLVGRDASDAPLHVYYSKPVHRLNDIIIASLDHDDLSGYGHETITLYALPTATLRYIVHDFSNRSNSGSLVMGGSNAIVTVYQGNTIAAQFTVRPNTPAVTWSVFDLLPTGEIVPVEQYDPEAVSAGAVGDMFQ